MLIDTHCHLQDPKAFPDPAATISQAKEGSVERMIVVGVNPPDWDLAIALAERFDEVFSILGWHPNFTADYDPATLQTLRQKLDHPKVLALGEIGLDYHWDFAPRDLQHGALDDQLELARSTRSPVVFHAREAYSDLLDVLEAFGTHPYLFHCFVGSDEDARRAIALDAYFGVDGPITYKKSDELRRMIANLPSERVVVETDSPYMAPVPFRGKPNQPAYIRYVIEKLAELWQVTTEEAGRITTENAVRFFGERLISCR